MTTSDNIKEHHEATLNMLQHPETSPKLELVAGKKLSTVGIRFTEEQTTGLRELTTTTGVELPTLVRIAVEGLLEYARHHKGRIMLPLDFTSVWKELGELETEIHTHLKEHPVPEERRGAEDPPEYHTK